MSIKDYLMQASVMLIGFAIVGVFLGLTVIMVVVQPDHPLTSELVNTLKSTALPAVIAAILVKDKGSTTP